MPTRTPAEIERLNKKRKREKLIFGIALVVVMIAFVIVCECHGELNPLSGSNALSTPEPDKRIEFIEKIGSGYTVSNDAVRLAVENGRGGADQVIVSESGGALTVVCRTNVEFKTLPDDYSPIFSSVDPSPDTDNTQLIEELSGDLSRYLAPLFPEKEMPLLGEKLLSAMTQLAGGADASTFLIDVYTVKAEYSQSGSLLTVTAAPSK